jgi:biopolymer transport protein ExbB/TolQ
VEAVKNRLSAELVSAFSYRLVRNAVFSVTGAFILVMGLFAYLQVFNTENAANVTAALSSLFGIVGTLVGAYFGIKASSDAQDRSADTAQKAVADQKETAQQAVTGQKETAQQAVTNQKEAAQQAVTNQKEAVAAASQTSPGASRSGPMKVALASLIPIAGGAGLLVLRHYLGRK